MRKRNSVFKSCLAWAALAVASSLAATSCGGHSVGPGSGPNEYKIWVGATYYAATTPGENTFITAVQGGVSPTFHVQPKSGYAFSSWLVTGSNVLPDSRLVLPDGTIATSKDNSLTLSNIQDAEAIYPVATNKAQTVALEANILSEISQQPVPGWCSEDGAFAYVGSLPAFPMSVAICNLEPQAWPIGIIEGTTPTVSRIWGINRQGWILYQYGSAQGSGVALLDASGVSHVITTASSVIAQAGINDSGTIFYGLPASATGSGPAQYYTQSGWDPGSAQQLAADLNAYFINDSGVIIGTSNGVGSVSSGTHVAYISGKEIPLPNVTGTLAAFGSDGTLTTVPSPGFLNIYGGNGQEFLTQVPNFQVDSLDRPNAFNRIIGHDRLGHTRIVGESTDIYSAGDWGYWDVQDGRFYDVSQETATGFDMTGYSVARIWCISDNDQLFVSLNTVPLDTKVKRKPSDGLPIVPAMLGIVAPYGQQGRARPPTRK